MANGRILSELFVGREKELTRFKGILHPDSGINVVNIHTNGDGGIGKTQLLQSGNLFDIILSHPLDGDILKSGRHA